MSQIQQSILQAEIESALRFCKIFKILKLLVAAALALAYFMNFIWLQELLILSVVLCLVVPLGFVDVFLQKLVEYNTQLIEERQLLNATEANKHFTSMNTRLSKLETKNL